MQNFSALFFAALLFLTGCSRPEQPLQHTIPKSCTIYDMRQAACIDEAELLRRLSPFRVVFAGDHHAEPAMHAVLAALIEKLGKSGRNVLLANEWFTPGDDALLSQYVSGAFDGNFTDAVGWKKKAGYPFASYAPVYAAVKDTGGRLYGVNMEKDFQKALSENNLTNAAGEERRFYASLDLNLSAHRKMFAPFFSRCHARQTGEDDEACLERMYRVQVAWDSYMAQQSAALAAAQLHTPKDLLIVFAGAMHLAYGIGINARFARRSREPFVTILPVPEGTANADVGEADYLLFYPAKPAEEGDE